VQFAFSSNAYRSFSLAETIEILAGLGYDGLEIMADTPHAFPPNLTARDIQHIRSCLDTHRMTISNINAFMLHAIGDTWHPSWIENDPRKRRLRVEHTLNCIDLAHKLGAQSISTEPGGPCHDMDQAEALKLFLEGLEEVQERARAKGVRVLIEPEPGLLVETSAQFLELMQDLDPAVFGLNFDIGHFFCVREDPAQLVPRLADHADHYHLEDIAQSRVHHHLLPGLGAIDLHGVLSAIEMTGYQGFVTVELYPYEDRPLKAARKAMAFLHQWQKTFEPQGGLS